VTVCIAAICQINDNPKIVICSDRQIGSALGTSEIHKQGDLRPGWMFQFAGRVDAAKTMLPLLKVYFKTHSGGIDEANIIEIAHSVVSERKRQLASEIILRWTSQTHGWFYQEGREKLPPDIFDAVWAEIRQLTLGCSFIVAGFIKTVPIAIEIDEDGTVKIQDDYVIIGEGDWLARSSLMHRKQNCDATLGNTIYCVTEAKRFAERVASVGRRTDLVIFSQDFRCSELCDSTWRKLDSLFGEYGPKEISTTIEFGNDSFIESPSSRLEFEE
jgi:hypothetical protein